MNSIKGFDIDKLEQMMSSSLRPVDPRPEFVNQLHRRLTDPLTPSIRYPRDMSLRFILLLIASLLSGIIFFVTMTQVIISFIKETKISRPIEAESNIKID
jgi:hypothetical protein